MTSCSSQTTGTSSRPGVRSTSDVEPEHSVAARRDGVSRAASDLVAGHCEALAQLASRGQRRVGRHDHVRLLGLDRFGVRFRAQSRSGCYDLRVPFAAPLDSPAGLGPAVDQLLTCRPS